MSYRGPQPEQNTWVYIGGEAVRRKLTTMGKTLSHLYIIRGPFSPCQAEISKTDKPPGNSARENEPVQLLVIIRSLWRDLERLLVTFLA